MKDDKKTSADVRAEEDRNMATLTEGLAPDRVQTFARVLDCYLADSARDLCAQDDANWERFLHALRRIVCHRVCKPWIPNEALFRWACARDILQAAGEVMGTPVSVTGVEEGISGLAP